MSKWFGQRKRRRRGRQQQQQPVAAAAAVPPQPQVNVPVLQEHNDDDNENERRRRRRRENALEEAFYTTGLVRKSVFAQQNPQFSKEEIDRFYDQDPVTKQYYGGKIHTKRSVQKVTASYTLNRIQLDLCEFRRSEYPFCLVAICCYSRFAWAKKLKSKSAADMIPALTELCEQWTREKADPSYFINVLVDAGLEWFSKQAKQLFKRYNIGLFKLQSSLSKAVVAEAFIKKLRNMLNMLVLREPQPWYQLIDKVLNIYNHTPHKSLFMQTPQNIYFRNRTALTKFQEKSRIKKPLAQVLAEAAKTIKLPQIKKFDFVRIMLLKSHSFAKGTDSPPISREVFIVEEVKPANIRDVNRLPMFRLKDLAFEPIIGMISFLCLK